MIFSISFREEDGTQIFSTLSVIFLYHVQEIVRRFRRLAQIECFYLRQSAKSADHSFLVYPD